MKFKYVYRCLYTIIIAHMVHKIYCRAMAKYHVPLIALLLSLVGIDLSIRPVKYDEDGDVIESVDEPEKYWRAVRTVKAEKSASLSGSPLYNGVRASEGPTKVYSDTLGSRMSGVARLISILTSTKKD